MLNDIYALINYKLLYLNQNELICKSIRTNNQYSFFNINTLELTYSFKVQSKQFNNNDDDILLMGANNKEIFLFNSNKKLLKIKNRLNGNTNKSIEFINDDHDDHNDGLIINPRNIKFDIDSNFLYKMNDLNQLRYYNLNNDNIIESKHSKLIHFNKCFDFTSQYDIYSFDNLNKKLYFL